MSLLNRRFIGLIVLLSFTVFSEAEASSGVCNIKVINEFPHDPQAYTQLSVRKVALLNGKVETVPEMQSSDFGEGLTLLCESSKSLLITCTIVGDWQLMGMYFLEVMEHQHYIRLPKTMKVIRKHVVKYQGHEVAHLNELEYVKN